jgi:outer membrane protein assembly factor BamD (BamD/ComL family)
MVKQLKLIAGLVITATLVACAGPVPAQQIQNDRSCSILSEGNDYYTVKNFSAAIDVYKKIESEDIENSGVCSGAVYATLATIYTYYGDESSQNEPAKANAFYRIASRYNRKFAYALGSRLRRFEPNGPK